MIYGRAKIQKENEIKNTITFGTVHSIEIDAVSESVVIFMNISPDELVKVEALGMPFNQEASSWNQGEVCEYDIFIYSNISQFS